MQQSTSTSTRVARRGQTEKERKLNSSAFRSNKLEQAMMLLNCIGSWLFRVMTAIPTVSTDVLHSASESLVENAEIICEIKLMCSKNI